MKQYPDLETAVSDALNLSQGMTFKFAVSGMNRGGGKAVIYLPKHFDFSLRDGLLQRYGALIKRLNSFYETGPDVGTNSADMDIISAVAAPHIYGRSPENGGSGSTGYPTAIGVFSGLEAVCQHLFGSPSLNGKRVLVQGVSSVGKALIDMLIEAKAEILFNDVNETAVHHFRDKLNLTFIPTDQLYQTPCDIFSPCALGGILNKETIPKLQCLGLTIK